MTAPEAGRAPRAAAAAACALLIAVPAVAAAAGADLDTEEARIRDALAARQDRMVELLARWVEINTGTRNRTGLQHFAKQIVPELEALDFEVTVEPGSRIERPGSEPFVTGPLIVARRSPGAGHETAPRFLLSGHMDTVFEPESPFRHFERSPDDPGTATGPGVADMKGGLVVMLFALKALHERGELDRAAWTVLLNSDEEIGSLGSRSRIEAAARRATFGFVFESAREDGAMVRSRRGLGQFHLSVTGVAAHAGSAHEKGRSAVRELAHKALRIEEMTDYERGITLNVGTFEGGTKRNVVPAHAEAWVDLRYDERAAGEEIRERMRELAGRSFVDGTRTRLWGRLHRPPKPASPEVDRLLGLHEEVAGALGVAVPEPVHAGGGTDGSLMAGVGLPALDSVGVVGANAHTPRELVDLASLAERASLAAILLRRLFEVDPPRL